MDEKWVVAAKKADFDAIASKFNIDKVVARILRNRELISDEEIGRFLNGTLADLRDGSLMKDMDKALFILSEAIREEKRIRIIGDYDVDGITAAFILKRGLSALGAKTDAVIPHRVTDGYGLNERLIREASEDGIDLILTCDNGIAASEQCELAYELGLKVVITDHHEVPYEEEDGIRKYILPKAEAVVDPKREDCPYPFPGICGAFIAYKLVGELLKSEFGRTRIDQGEAEDLMRELMAFAALATVCDVMELMDENRILVKYGLREMERTENTGLAALIAVNDLSGKELSCYTAGFVIGPCLNATGRLDSAGRALELFDERDRGKALAIATELRELNEARKKMTEDGAKEAIRQAEEGELSGDRVLVIFLPDVHESIAGIIAGRVKERCNRPCIVTTTSGDGVKGSGRSIEGYDMFEELTKVKDLFTKFGGHKMAAGLSLASEEDVYELRRRLNDNCTLTEEDLVKKIRIDVPMPLSYLSMHLTEQLSILEPFGTGNPKPVFADKEVTILSHERVGKTRSVGRLRIRNREGKRFTAVYFGDQDALADDLSGYRGKEIRADIIYYPLINEYRGERSLEIRIDGYRLRPQEET